jgi:hypothetical protein
MSFETFEAKRRAVAELCMGRFWGMKRFHKTRGVAARLLSILLLGLLASVPAHAALLGLDTLLQQNPDLFSGNLSANLTVSFSNGLLTVTGDTQGYTVPAGGDPLVVSDTTGGFGSGTFSLIATIKTNGVLQSGSLTISGAIDDLSIPASTLLSGNITAFGFQGSSSPNPDEFEFLFNVTGGALAADYGPVGGTLLHPGDTSFNGSFLTNFSNDGNGLADTRAIPEPSSVLLVVMSLLGLCGIVRRVPLRKSSRSGTSNRQVVSCE